MASWLHAGLLALTIGTAAISGTAASAANLPPGALRWTAGNLPPFGWLGPDGPHGYAYELVVHMSGKLGRPSEVSFYPWARAVRMTREGTEYGTFPLLRTADREAHFRWLILLSNVRHTFFGRAGATLDLADERRLRGERIGVLRGSPHVLMLRGKDYKSLIEAMDYKDMLRMLNEGIVDAVYATEPTLKAAIDELGFGQRDFRTGLSYGEQGIYMATSVKADAAESERWVKAYKELQQDGTVARLQKKYLYER